ncbi:MAG: hypothetical protein AB7O24_20265 [Kofleriaceae bacterium]
MVTRALVVTCGLAAAFAGCGGRALGTTTRHPGIELTLHSDKAVVTQRIEVAVGPSKRTEVKLAVPSDVQLDDIVVIDRDGLTIAAINAPLHDPVRPEVAESEFPDDESLRPVRTQPLKPARSATDISYVVAAPRAGRFVLTIGYVTRLIRWDASYMMTAAAQRDHVVLTGAVAIRNRTGVRYPRAKLRLIDDALGAGGVESRERDGKPAGSDAHNTRPDKRSGARERALGPVDLATGETRVDLAIPPSRHPLRSVLVYDPIGTALDSEAVTPNTNAKLGTAPAPSRVTESLEIARGRTTNLPRGRVTLVERKSDGTLGLLGEAMLFEPATRESNVDTIPLGIADKVTGKRERTEITIDQQGHRIVEEFMLTIDNARSVPIEVVLREHLYRGQNWTLAFQSSDNPTKEGPQQIAMHTRVAANSSAKVLYVVVYTWE